MGIEVKAKNGRASPLQIHNLKQIDEAGGFGILLYPEYWDCFKDFINSMLNYDYEGMLGFYDVLKSRWENE